MWAHTPHPGVSTEAWTENPTTAHPRPAQPRSWSSQSCGLTDFAGSRVTLGSFGAPWAWTELQAATLPAGSCKVTPSSPEASSCPLSLVLGPQSKAPGAAGGEGLQAQEGADIGPGGTELGPAAEGHSGKREGHSAQCPGPGTLHAHGPSLPLVLSLPPRPCSPSWALGPSPELPKSSRLPKSSLLSH